MKLEPRTILTLFLIFSDSEPQYSYKLHSYKKSVYKNEIKLDGHVSPHNYQSICSY